MAVTVAHLHKFCVHYTYALTHNPHMAVIFMLTLAITHPKKKKRREKKNDKRMATKCSESFILTNKQNKKINK